MVFLSVRVGGGGHCEVVVVVGKTRAARGARGDDARLVDLVHH